MDSTAAAKRRPRRSPDKRQAILDGARVTFAREGYTRASIDAIAAAAEVSTRTLYNHFGDKARLFEEVIRTSATEVAEAQLELIESYLGDGRLGAGDDGRLGDRDELGGGRPSGGTDVEPALTRFAVAWARPNPQFADHFALVRQIRAEVGHLPPAVLEAWQQAGPQRVQSELARRLRRLAERGLLRIDDPDRAAFHLSLLAAAEVESRSYHGAIPVPDAEIAELATAGIRVFLKGYLP